MVFDGRCIVTHPTRIECHGRENIGITGTSTSGGECLATNRIENVRFDTPSYGVCPGTSSTVCTRTDYRCTRLRPCVTSNARFVQSGFVVGRRFTGRPSRGSLHTIAETQFGGCANQSCTPPTHPRTLLFGNIVTTSRTSTHFPNVRHCIFKSSLPTHGPRNTTSGTFGGWHIHCPSSLLQVVGCGIGIGRHH